MPRGGRREGRPGAAYQNRTDLNKPTVVPIRAATGQQYGKAGAQIAAQRAMPIAAPPPPATGAPVGPPAGGPPAPPVPPPGAVMPLDAPTQRPNEPITAGMAVGPGPGVEANPFSAVGSPDDAVLALRAAYSVYPSEELRMVLERIDLDD